MAHVFNLIRARGQSIFRQLHAALERLGRDVWVDWDDILEASPFWRDIETAIEAADAVIFVVSPDSIESGQCWRELEHAAANQKRIVPIIWRDADPAKAPSVVAKLHWKISFVDGVDFEHALNDLTEAIDRDLEWVKEHTRLQEAANEWDRNGRRRADLARGERLAETERSLAAAIRARKKPVPSPSSRGGLRILRATPGHSSARRGSSPAGRRGDAGGGCRGPARECSTPRRPSPSTGPTGVSARAAPP